VNGMFKDAVVLCTSELVASRAVVSLENTLTISANPRLMFFSFFPVASLD
jgi:hypothetical protein